MNPSTIYLDTSLALFTFEDGKENTIIKDWMNTTPATFVSSRLFATEVIRGLRRENKPISFANAIIARVNLINITEQTHVLAESLEMHTKTLDALHIATALMYEGSIQLATHDTRMKEVAQHYGMVVIDPLDPKPSTE